MQNLHYQPDQLYLSELKLHASLFQDFHFQMHNEGPFFQTEC